MTRNGSASSYVTPSTVTWFSCMHSSSAACVFGEARFTSSTRTRFAKTGPGRNSNSLAFWLKTFTPVTSDGSKSGVNWMREKEQSTDRASAFASIVFPTPGKSSMIRCPSATRQSTVMRSVSSDAWTTRCRLRTIAVIASAAAEMRGARSASKEPFHLVEDGGRDLLLRRLRDRALAVRADERDLVVGGVEADVGAGDVVEDEEIGALVAQLRAGALEAGVAAVGGEADEDLPVGARPAEAREHVGRRLELDRPRRAVLRPLAGQRLGRPVIGDPR